MVDQGLPPTIRLAHSRRRGRHLDWLAPASKIAQFRKNPKASCRSLREGSGRWMPAWFGLDDVSPGRSATWPGRGRAKWPPRAIDPKSTRPSSPRFAEAARDPQRAAGSAREEPDEVVFRNLPLSDCATVEDFLPAQDCRYIAGDVHGAQAWNWIKQTVGPMPKLPTKLRRAVLRYTGADYHVINQAMVEGKGTDLVMSWVAQIQEAMGRSHLPVPLRLYRSSSPRWLHAPGQQFRADHLISTSVDCGVATNWLPAQPYRRRTLWAIDAPAGIHAIWGAPNNRSQAEVLLAGGTRFVVENALRNSRGDALMHVSVVPSL